MLGHGFDFMDPIQGEGGLFKLGEVFFRNDMDLCPCLGIEDFDFQICLELVLVAPDVTHAFSRITFNHDECSYT